MSARNAAAVNAPKLKGNYRYAEYFAIYDSPNFFLAYRARYFPGIMTKKVLWQKSLSL